MMRWQKPVFTNNRLERRPTWRYEKNFISDFRYDHSLFLRQNQSTGHNHGQAGACRQNLGALAWCLTEIFVEFTSFILHFFSFGHGINLLPDIWPDF
jgi:hypothetical protein